MLHQNSKIVVLMYHEVTDEPLNTGINRPSAMPYKITVQAFADHLASIHEKALPVFSLFSAEKNSEKMPIFFTFDDGGISNVLAAKMLEKYGWRGHFFVTTNRIGQPGFLSEQDIIDLHRRGHIVGSHSHHHPDVFYRLSEDEMRQEWQESCEILSEILGEKITTASVPGGDMDFRTIRAAADSGITDLFTSEVTVVPWHSCGVRCYGRLCPRRDVSQAEFDRMVLADPILLFNSREVRRLKKLGKKILAPFYRRAC